MTHPGTIRFENVDDGTVEDRSLHEVPPSIAFVEVDGAARAVVRIVRRGREITAYGADGAALQRTYTR